MKRKSHLYDNPIINNGLVFPEFNNFRGKLITNEREIMYEY